MELILILGGFACIVASYAFEDSAAIAFKIAGILMLVGGLSFFAIMMISVGGGSSAYKDPKPTHFGGIPIKQIKEKYGK